MGTERVDFHSVERIYKMLDLLVLYPELGAEEIKRRFSNWDTKEKGVLAEARALRVLKSLPYVHNVEFSKKHEDNIDKIDLWVTLIKRLGLEHRDVPVQVKSSFTGCNGALKYFEINTLKIKRAPGFKRPVVLNAGLKVSDQEIIEGFSGEIKTLTRLDLTRY